MEPTPAPRPARMLLATGTLGAGFFLAHAVHCLAIHEPWDLLWSCNVACGLVGVAQLARNATLNAVALMWLVIGTPCWFLDLAAGTPVQVTSCLTHVGALLVAIAGVPFLGMPRGSWWKALLGLMALQEVARLTTAPEANVNLAFAVYPWTKGVIPSYALYWGFLLVVFTASFVAVERIGIRLAGARAATQARGGPP